MRNLKVLICSPAPPPRGGIATWTEELQSASKNIENLEIYLVDTSIARPPGTYSLQRKVIDGLKTITPQIRKLIHGIRKTNPDIIHICSSGGMAHLRDILFILICIFYRKKTALHLHYGCADEGYQWVPGGRLFLKIASSLSSACLILDERIKNIIKNKKTHLVYNGMTPPSPHKKINKRKEVVFVGWIIEQKGIFDLVKSWQGIENKNNWSLKIIGPANEYSKKQLDAMINKDTSINYLGELSREKVIEEVETSAAFIIPSLTEGFPYAILEAMSLKCCIISTDVGGISQIYNHNEPPGWIIKNKSMLRPAIEKLISCKEQDVALQGENAYRILTDRYTSTKMAQNLFTIWSEIKQSKPHDHKSKH